MSNKPTTPFLLLHLPLLVLKEIFTSSTTYELFAFSILSRRAKRIVKLACSHRKFKVNFDPSLHDNYNSLSFLGMYVRGSHENGLTLHVESNDVQVPTCVLKLNGNVVPARVEFKKVGSFSDDTVLTYCENKNFGSRWMCQHLTDTFKISSLDLRYSGNDKSVLIETATFLRTLQPINSLYDSGGNIYSFEEVISFMPSKLLGIQYPKMKYSQFITLFKMWKEGRAAEEIRFYNCPKHMSIRPLARLVEGRPEVFVEDNYRALEVIRNDGRCELVDAYFGQIRFYIVSV